jgi:beta-glucosidase
MITDKIKELISQMTLEEKAGLCSGGDFWHTKPVERLGVPSIMLTDGPHGLRKQADASDHLGLNESINAVCFPAGCAAAASWNPSLIHTMGETIGSECQAENIAVILGPAVNIKRSPLCGRNFEYYSEDPLLATECAAALIDGVQSKGAGTSIKHFFGNNQETRRMSSSSEIDERTLHEIYLAVFEGAVKKSKPWTVMNSYNKINGKYMSENKKYLTDVLRDEWGFEGFVVSDWGAVNHRVRDIAAGLDLEMPSSNGAGDKQIVEAVKNGELREEVVDQACERILSIVYKYVENHDSSAVFNYEADNETARKIAEECVVLLKNDEKILPLDPTKKIAFIGKYAESPRYQGGGSSHINAFKVTSALECAPANVIYARGFNDDKDETDEALVEEAVKAAKDTDVAVIFAGLPEAFESEGFDRNNMRLPDSQNLLISKIAAVQPNIVVVLHGGSPVELPWINEVKGLVNAYLGGQAIGAATVDILFGNTNPSGKLPESFPIKLEDNPSYLNFPGEKDVVSYKEGVFVGYRYYDKKRRDVLFPFGHGLSYTSFEYSDITVDKSIITDKESVTVSVDVTNTGDVNGKEVIQLYVAPPQDSSVIRPIRELRAFYKEEIKPGETKAVSFTLGKRAFAYWNTDIHDWYVPSGIYQIETGSSSRDIRRTIDVSVTGEPLKVIYTQDTPLIDVFSNPDAKAICDKIISKITIFSGITDSAAGAISNDMMQAMINYMPIRAVVSFGGLENAAEEVKAIVEELNAL